MSATIEFSRRKTHSRALARKCPKPMKSGPGLRQSCPEPNLRGTETVLVMAEEPTLQKILARVLGELGYCVLCAGNGAEAQFQSQSGPHIDLLLLDQDMPEPRNEQLAIWFRATYPEIKVLMASGSLWEINLGLAMSQQISLLAKPFTLSQLAQMLRRVLEGPVPAIH